ncbi:MAG: hypothetical protein R3B07_11895 [Polyangiaceae bacterium]
MQSTLTEHAESRARDRPCAACHMPLSAGLRDHGFEQVRDPAWLRKRLKVEARRTAWRSLEIELSQTNPAHAFPTGDLFRRLEVGAELVDEQGSVVTHDVTYMRREFRAPSSGVGREQVADERLFNDPRTLELDVACDSSRRGHLRWWVSLQRVTFEGDTDRTRTEIDSESRIAEGKIECHGEN